MGVRFEISGSSFVYANDAEPERKGYDVAHGFCPECSHLIVILRKGRYYQPNFDEDGSRELMPPFDIEVIYPGTVIRKVDREVPKGYQDEFAEASRTAPVSAKASAALSRRLLQQIFWDELGIRKGNLASEIEEFVARPGVPSSLSSAVDPVRTIGNFAAHPMKDQNTREVIDVEPGEAEWLPDVLESLFDFVFVQPRRLAARRDVLNEKLRAAGKPVLKS